MIISLIVAMDEAGGIGLQGGLPWRLPDDLKRFKQLTMGHPLIVGRKTWESIGRPLPGRKMIVVTRNPGYLPEGSLRAASLEEALSIARQGGEEEAFIAGGGQLYTHSLPLAERIYLTRVHTTLPADTFFPDFEPALWQVTSQEAHPADEKNPIPFTWQVWERVGNKMGEGGVKRNFP